MVGMSRSPGRPVARLKVAQLVVTGSIGVSSNSIEGLRLRALSPEARSSFLPDDTVARPRSIGTAAVVGERALEERALVSWIGGERAAEVE